MRALADFAVDDLLQRVDALGRVLGVGDEHEMHAMGVLVCAARGWGLDATYVEVVVKVVVYVRVCGSCCVFSSSS